MIVRGSSLHQSIPQFVTPNFPSFVHQSESSDCNIFSLSATKMTSTCLINRHQCVLPTVHRPPNQLQYTHPQSHKLLPRALNNRALGLGLCNYSKKGRSVRSRAVVSMVQLDVGVSKEGAPEQTVVIVGAGIAGLATALALHRVGVKALVLEQSGGLRTEGTSLSLFPNAWRALDALGVADLLRGSFINCTGARMRTPDGTVVNEFSWNSDFPERPPELRAVERQTLLRVLAEALPSDTIKFNSRVKNIRKPRDKQLVTEVELDDSTVITTKVLVGCDGAGSVVASWMGRSEPRPVGQMAIRGMAEFENGHQLEPRVEQLLGQGVRAGYVPVSRTKVYWFVLFNINSSVPLRVTDPKEMKEEALRYTQGWPIDMQECIQKTPLETLNRRNIKDRWSIPLVTPQAAASGVTLAGDAAHPMSPYLGQGGCTALEDAIILTRKLREALRAQEQDDASVLARKIGSALSEYESERWARTFGLTVKSFVFGYLLSLEFAPICFLRDKLALPRMFRASAIFGSSNFDCGALPPPLK